MIKLFIIAGVVFLVGWIIRQPAIKGMFGELLVKFCLKRNLDLQTYRLLNNVMIHDNNGGTTQIDHLVLSPFGIFVVETKNMRGWIFGDKNSDQWTQQLFKTKNKFQNPFRQNYKHIMCLGELTGLPKDAFIHTIVFAGDCVIKTRDKLPESLVTSGQELVKYIHSFTTPRFSEEEIEATQAAILTGKVDNTMKNRREHVAHVKEIIEDKSSQPPTCPKCGSPMVQRQVKSGDRSGQTFWGCSQYPKCRGIVNS